MKTSDASERKPQLGTQSSRPSSGSITADEEKQFQEYVIADKLQKLTLGKHDARAEEQKVQRHDETDQLLTRIAKWLRLQ